MSIARLRYVTAALFALMLWTAPGQADPRIHQVAAAISLAERAVQTGDAALLTAAAEMLHALAPGGADLLTEYTQEARFLARGDRGLLARLDALRQAERTDGALVIERIAAGRTGVFAPPGVEAMGLYPWLPPGDGAAAACTGGLRGLVSLCDPLALEDYRFEKDGYAIYLMQSEARE